VGDWVERKVGSVWKLVRGKKNEEKNVREALVKKNKGKKNIRHLSHSYSLGKHYFNRLGVFFSKFVTNQSIEQPIRLHLVLLTPCMRSL